MNIQNYLEFLSYDELIKVEKLLIIEKRKKDPNYKNNIINKITSKIICDEFRIIARLYNKNSNNTKYISDYNGSQKITNYINQSITSFVEELNIYELKSLAKLKIDFKNNLSDFIFFYYAGGHMTIDYCILFLNSLYHNQEPKELFNSDTLNYFYNRAFESRKRYNFLDFNDLIKKFKSAMKLGINFSLTYGDITHNFNIPPEILIN